MKSLMNHRRVILGVFIYRCESQTDHIVSSSHTKLGHDQGALLPGHLDPAFPAARAELWFVGRCPRWRGYAIFQRHSQRAGRRGEFLKSLDVGDNMMRSNWLKRTNQHFSPYPHCHPYPHTSSPHRRTPLLPPRSSTSQLPTLAACAPQQAGARSTSPSTSSQRAYRQVARRDSPSCASLSGYLWFLSHTLLSLSPGRPLPLWPAPVRRHHGLPRDHLGTGVKADPHSRCRLWPRGRCLPGRGRRVRPDTSEPAAATTSRLRCGTSARRQACTPAGGLSARGSVGRDVPARPTQGGDSSRCPRRLPVARPHPKAPQDVCVSALNTAEWRAGTLGV